MMEKEMIVLKLSFAILAFISNVYASDIPLLTQQLPTRQQDILNLNVSVIGFNGTMFIVQLCYDNDQTLLSNLVNKNCIDTNFVTGLNRMMYYRTLGVYQKIDSILTILEQIPAPVNLQILVQNEALTYQNFLNSLNQSKTNTQLLSVAKGLNRASMNTNAVTLPQLIAYINQNNPGLLGLPINTLQCVCADKLFKLLSDNTSSGISLSDITDPPGNPNNNLVYQLQNVLTTTNETCQSILVQTMSLNTMLGALNSSDCRADYMRHLLTVLNMFTAGVNIKLAQLLPLTIALDATSISSELQGELDILAGLNATLSKPDVSNGNIQNVVDQFLPLLVKITGQTIPTIANYILDSQKGLANKCVCAGSLTQLLLNLGLPLVTTIVVDLGSLIKAVLSHFK